MKWMKHHMKAQSLAEMAELVIKHSPLEGVELYRLAAQEEFKASEALNSEPLPRTRAIVTVSTVALALKAEDSVYFDDVARHAMSYFTGLPQWARNEVTEMIAAAGVKWKRSFAV